MIKPIYKNETVIICGTGPSITPEVIEKCNKAKKDGKVRLFGVNLAYTVFDLDLLHACNWQFYAHYYPVDESLRNATYFKWTSHPEAKDKYDGVNHIQGLWEDGFSTDPNYIHAHHGSSPQVMNLALHYGFKTQLLVGFDMKFPGKINDRNYTEERHFHPETPLTSQHWPRTEPNGDLGGLIREMETIKPEDYGIEIINCTPNSAMTCFPMMDLDEALEAYGHKEKRGN